MKPFQKWYSLSHAPVLAFPDPDLPLKSVVDANGCDAVLLQNYRPVAVHSYQVQRGNMHWQAGTAGCEEMAVPPEGCQGGLC